MTTKQSAVTTGFTRCAVCKIDLKGRFVYLDEKIEALLGLTKEELFGKSLLEFLDEPSQQLVEQLLSHRNHYETFYDTTFINMYNCSRAVLRMRVVVSLNFIAGNPVNYQLIIDHQDPAQEKAGTRHSSDYRAFIQQLSKIGSFGDLKQLLMLLCRFVGARQASIYLVTDEGLQPRSAVTRLTTGEFEFNREEEIGSLLEHVARTGEEYSFIDQKAVQRVVEQCGYAPNEFVTCLSGAAKRRYLVRLVFDEDFDHNQAQVSVCDARLALELFAGLISSSIAESDGSCDIRFTIGFLDSLGIGALLTDADGSIIGYNPSALKLFSEDALDGNYLNLLKSLSHVSPSDIIRRTVDYLNARAGDENFSDDLTLEMKTSNSRSVRLTIMKLSDEPGDISGCFVFAPGTTGTFETARYHCDIHVWKAILGLLRQNLKPVSDAAEQLGHDFYNELGASGNAGLEKMTAGVRKLKDSICEMLRFTRLVKGDELARITDLSFLVREQAQQISTTAVGDTFKCNCETLPKIRTKPELLGYALRCILDNGLKYNDKATKEIDVVAQIRDGRCEMRISDNGFGVAAKSLPRVFDPLYRVSDKKVRAIEGHGLGLTLAREAVRVLGGDISIASTVGEGTRVTIVLPEE